MKRALFSIFLILCTLTIFAQGFTHRREARPYQTTFAQPQPGVYQITFDIQNADVREVEVGGSTYSKIEFASTTVLEKAGWAALPFVSAAIELPADKDVDIEVTPVTSSTIQLQHPLLPSRGTIYRNQDPASIPYQVDPASLTETNYPSEIATMETPFIVRDVRGTSVRVFPFHYNATNNTVTLYSRVIVTLRENNRPATNPLTRINPTPVKDAIGLYQSMFLNYEPSRDALAQGEKGDILVYTTSTYESAADLYIQWKKEMGYNVTKEVVTTNTNVVNAIQTAYNSNPNLMYVQLFGDWADIKSNTITVDGEAAPTDPRMGCVSGSDNYPDIAIGRFSCSTNAQALVQVNKAINYEKNPNMDAGWRETFIGIGSNEGSGSGDDGEIDYTHIQRIYSERLNPFTYNTENGNYGSSASASTLATHVNAGASTIAYCGHGSETYFVTTNYSNTNVNASTNGDKLPFIVSVACVNGKFNLTSGDCFAEAWLKKENGGAVVTLMSTINQPWTPPQRGQDYFYDILVGGFNYNSYSDQSGINTNEQRTHWGSIVVNAFTLALTESNTSSDLETFRTWTTFGDASLQLRTKQPVTISSSLNALMTGVPFTTTITSNGTPVADALVCLSQNGNYYSAYTDANGQVSIEHDFAAGNVLLVVTAFNTTTIYQEIPCSAGNVPYLVLDSYTPDIVEFGQEPYLTLALKNMGGAATSGTTHVTLTSDSPMITFIDAEEDLGVIAANNGIGTATNGFRLSINQNIPTGVTHTLHYTATCGSDSWTGSFNLTSIGSDCQAPTGLTATADGQNIVLTWDDNSAFVTVTHSDDVEGHTYGTINSAGTIGWTYIDGDNTSTGSFNDVTYTNEGSAMAFIVLDDSQMSGSNVVTAHSGHKYFADAYASGGWWNTVQNDDWLISPQLNYSGSATISFFARSYSSSYSAEQFEVAYSTTGTAASDFTAIGASTTTTTTWTEYSFTIPDGAKYVAIHCISNDQYIFCLDDIVITGEEGSGPRYNLYRDGQLIASNISGGTYTDQNLASGTYCYTLRVACDNDFESNGTTECATVGTPVEQPCDIVTNLVATPAPGMVSLSWDAAPNAISYKIYRNGSVLCTITDTQYQDMSVSDNTTYAYAVRTICSGGQSDLSSVVNCQTGLAQYSSAQLRIFPNPAHDVINVECPGMKQVELFTAIGTKIAEMSVANGSTTLKVSELSRGIYFLRIIQSDGAIITRKVMIDNK